VTLGPLGGRTTSTTGRGLLPPARLAIGVDIGGTKVAAGLVDSAGRVVQRARRETPHRSTSAQVVEDTIADVVEELRGHREAVAVGIGAAGFVDADRSSVLFAPHLSWRHEPLREALRRRFGLVVVVENDANAALWAEHRFGAGRDEDDVVMVNLGTGIGGGLLVDGALFRGGYGIAGEFGHMQVEPGGRRCECGNRGCWEQYASGNALVREARELCAAGSPVAHGLLDRVGGDVSRITGPTVTEAATDGDAAAVELFEEIGRWLGIGRGARRQPRADQARMAHPLLRPQRQVDADCREPRAIQRHRRRRRPAGTRQRPPHRQAERRRLHDVDPAPHEDRRAAAAAAAAHPAHRRLAGQTAYRTALEPPPGHLLQAGEVAPQAAQHVRDRVPVVPQVVHVVRHQPEARRRPAALDHRVDRHRFSRRLP
jgi:glucokinase